MAPGFVLLYLGYALLWWGAQLVTGGQKSPPLIYALTGLGSATRS